MEPPASGTRLGRFAYGSEVLSMGYIMFAGWGPFEVTMAKEWT